MGRPSRWSDQVHLYYKQLLASAGTCFGGYIRPAMAFPPGVLVQCQVKFLGKQAAFLDEAGDFDGDEFRAERGIDWHARSEQSGLGHRSMRPSFRRTR
jgi:hypothetical protein